MNESAPLIVAFSPRVWLVVLVVLVIVAVGVWKLAKIVWSLLSRGTCVG
jgi:hypothetical protein